MVQGVRTRTPELETMVQGVRTRTPELETMVQGMRMRMPELQGAVRVYTYKDLPEMQCSESGTHAYQNNVLAVTKK